MSSYNSFSLLILFSLLLFFILDSANLTVSSCQPECGGIEIPYPFGIGEGCYLEKWYEITCNTSTPRTPVPYLSVINKEVVNISLPSQYEYYDYPLSYGSIRIKTPITSKGCSSNGEELGGLLNLTDTPFYVSNRNTLVAVGCDNTASLTDVEPSTVGCKSSCSTKPLTPVKDYLALVTCNTNYGYDDRYCNNNVMGTTRCSGFKCCKANMPGRIQQIVGVKIDNTTGGCKVAFLTDEPDFYDGSDPQRLYAKRYSTVELGWFFHTANRSFVKSLGCYEIKKHRVPSYISYFQRRNNPINCLCDYNAHLSYARCLCNRGFKGNPYLLGGCKDINECEVKDFDENGNPVTFDYCGGEGGCVNLGL